MRKWLLIALHVFFMGVSYGQIIPVKIDEYNGRRAVPWDASITINPEDGDNIVGAVSGNRIYTTFDGGETWLENKINTGGGSSGIPVIVADVKGRFYYFHGLDAGETRNGFERILCHRSKDRGNTWEVSGQVGQDPPGDKDLLSVVSDGKGKLYTAWTQFDQYGSNSPEHKSNILFSRSKNGKKWETPIRINKQSGNCANDNNTTIGARPAISHDGKIYIAWAYNKKIYLDRSFDKGRLWIRGDIEILEQPGGWDFDVTGFKGANGYPKIGVYNLEKSPLRDRIFVTWSDQRNGPDDTDIWISWSDNFGDHFTAPKRVNDDPGGSHQFLPSLAVDPVTGFIYILYYDRRNYDDLRTDVYLAYSENAGKDFHNRRLTQEPFIPDEDQYFGRYITIDAYDGRIAAIWHGVDEANVSLWTAVFDHETLVTVTH